MCCPQKAKAAEKSEGPNASRQKPNCDNQKPQLERVKHSFLLLESEKTGSFSLFGMSLPCCLPANPTRYFCQAILYAILLIKSRGGVDICTGDICRRPIGVNLRRQSRIL